MRVNAYSRGLAGVDVSDDDDVDVSLILLAIGDVSDVFPMLVCLATDRAAT
jgi:hypothetical protein